MPFKSKDNSIGWVHRGLLHSNLLLSEVLQQAYFLLSLEEQQEQNNNKNFQGKKNVFFKEELVFVSVLPVTGDTDMGVWRLPGWSLGSSPTVLNIVR